MGYILPHWMDQEPDIEEEYAFFFTLIIIIWFNFKILHDFVVCRFLIYSYHTFFNENIFKKYYLISKSVESDQAWRFVGPSKYLNCQMKDY